MPSRQGRAADGERKTRVAIIGTGLAGLTTAYLLHHDAQKRYEVTLFEQVSNSSSILTAKEPVC